MNDQIKNVMESLDDNEITLVYDFALRISHKAGQASADQVEDHQ